jgi:hypothetical protein
MFPAKVAKNMEGLASHLVGLRQGGEDLPHPVESL